MERELTADERGILEFLLADLSLPAGDALRAQVPCVRVVDGVPAMPTYLHLAVASGAPLADCPDGKGPIADAVVVSSSGETTGFVLLWTQGGFLSTVEHAWVTDEMPDEFPSVDRLRRLPSQAN